MTWKTKEAKNTYQNQRLKQARLDWLNANGPCKSCGSWERLEVDHIDPTTKVTHRVWSMSVNERDKELAKCQPLCHVCHKEKTAASKRKPLEHGTFVGYTKHACRCEDCAEANRTHAREWARKKRARLKADLSKS